MRCRPLFRRRGQDDRIWWETSVKTRGMGGLGSRCRARL